MLDRDAESEPNPYAAPTVLDSPPIDENGLNRATELRSRHADAERRVRLAAWLNLFIGIPWGFAAMIISIAWIADMDLRVPGLSKASSFPILLILTMFVSSLNIWIWHGLRRFSPSARRLDIALSILALLNTVRWIAVGLNQGVTGDFWLGRVSVPFTLAILILYLLTRRGTQAIFAPEYQRAVAQTRYNQR
jgi:hypothetical protein